MNVVCNKEIKKINADFHILSCGCLESQSILRLLKIIYHMLVQKDWKGLTFHPALKLGTLKKREKN